MTDPAATGRRFGPAAIAYVAAILAAVGAIAALGAKGPEGIALLDGKVPLEFVLFVLTLLGVALFHHHTLAVAVSGLAAVSAYKLLFVGGFHLGSHLVHEWRIVVNLLGLLVGFAILAKYFEESRVPDWIPRILPDKGIWGGFVLLAYIFILSSFLDNIAAAMIGGVIARTAFRGKVSVAYIAAIVAASNAGGAGSVVGDTTTTMMWIDGVAALDVTHAFVASAVALLVIGPFASAAQQKHSPMIIEDKTEKISIDGARLSIVALILACAIAANALLDFPAAGVWAAILVGAFIRRPSWHEVPGAAKGACFLLSLVLCASMMPVKSLPDASWKTAFGLGFVSAVFDNIPLTKLALEQGGYDWGMLAYAVGFGGSMIWFGSSAGVAISKDYPEARNTGKYLKDGWFVIVAYVVGFFALQLLLPWHPTIPHKDYRLGGVPSAVVLDLADGGHWKVSAVKGKPQVLVLADAGSPEEIAALRRLESASAGFAARGAGVLGILHGCPPGKVGEIRAAGKLGIPLASEDRHDAFDSLSKETGVHTVVLDAEGRIAFLGVGFDEKAVEGALDALPKPR